MSLASLNQSNTLDIKIGDKLINFFGSGVEYEVFGFCPIDSERSALMNPTIHREYHTNGNFWAVSVRSLDKFYVGGHCIPMSHIEAKHILVQEK